MIKINGVWIASFHLLPFNVIRVSQTNSKVGHIMKNTGQMRNSLYTFNHNDQIVERMQLWKYDFRQVNLLASCHFRVHSKSFSIEGSYMPLKLYDLVINFQCWKCFELAQNRTWFKEVVWVQLSLLGLSPVLSDSCALSIKSLEEAFEVVFKTILSHYLP